MRLEYIRKPTRIFLDVDSNGAMMADAPNPNYLANIGSVNCELTEFQRQEIVDMMVETYLERVKDERYKSNLQEQMIKAVCRPAQIVRIGLLQRAVIRLVRTPGTTRAVAAVKRRTLSSHSNH